MSSWRSLLPASTEDEGPPLALGVELRQRDAYDPARWEPRAVTAVTPRALARRQEDLSVAMRPMVPGARGAWIKGDASWDAVRRSPQRYRPSHARWFGELHAIVSVTRVAPSFGAVADWLTLDAATSRHVWAHLAAAADLGIPIVPTHPRQSVHLAASADVGVEVVPATDGRLDIRARVRIDGVAWDPATARAIGDGGLYAFALERDPVPLILAPADLPDPLPALLGAAGITVPARETGQFFRELYPVLARRVPVATLGGLEPPAPPAPVLRVAVAFRPEHTTAYALAWSCPGMPPVPLADAAGGGDDHAESGIVAEARRAWTDASTLPFAASGQLRDADAAEFSARVLPALEAVDGVRIETTGARPAYRELSGDPAITVSTVETRDPDWFDLGIIVTIDGRRIPFGPLFAALARGRRRLMLSDGAYFSLAHPALQRLRELLAEAESLSEWETGPRIARTQVAVWEDFEDLADLAEPARTWRGLVASLREGTHVPPAPVPAVLRARLRPYQEAGFSWLATLWRHRLGGILADDMGLGKTLQSLALVAHTREQGERRPFLVVAPTSVLPAWTGEAARFVPDLRVATVDSTRRRRAASVADLAASADILVTSYAVLRLDAADFAGVEWAGVLLDEAQFVKNPHTQLHRAVASLRTGTTVALTGTPLENSLTDLWALLSLTAPGLFPSARRFRQEYVRPIEQAQDAAGTPPTGQAAGDPRARRLDRLRRRIRPFVLRRTKEHVAADLPPRQEQDVRVELTPAHRSLYDAVLQRERQKVLGLLEDLDRNRFIVFRSITLLRLLSLDPGLVDPQHADIGSAKLDALLDRLAEVAAEGHRALVFSQFTSFLARAAARLEAAGVRYEYLDGGTRRRGETIDAFRGGDAPVFLLSLRAGGFGLTLTEADYVFLLDPWWNPAAESQAVDRVHRIGQTRNVFVYRLLSAGTIEEKVAALQRRKAELFRSVLDDGEMFARQVDAEDIRALFGS